MHDMLTAAGDFSLGMGVLVGAIVQLLNWRTNHRNGERINAVAVQTDGIKDALVKVTGESEFAKGLLAGKENPK
jgi:hypothetical protein